MTIRCTQCGDEAVEYKATHHIEEWDCQACGYTVRQLRHAGYVQKGTDIEPELHQSEVTQE